MPPDITLCSDPRSGPGCGPGSDLDPALAAWSYTADAGRCLLILPDGCRDFIVRRSPGGAPRLEISPVMSAPQRVAVAPGDAFLGVRLQPGARIRPGALDGAPVPDSPEELAALARGAAWLPPGNAEILAALAAAPCPARAARCLGVSLRTLQRHTLAATGHPPDFWRRLARARRAARAILRGVPLPEAACAGGYADQAHMTRDLGRWFAMTPGALAAARTRKDHPARHLCDPGYDAPWTGEQISTR
jgi:AraC-like DNA-binding protein